MTATVTPIRPDIVIPVEPVPDPKQETRTYTCPVCGITETASMRFWQDWLVECRSCGLMLHRECYWGRVAALEEWRVYLAWLNTEESEGTAAWAEWLKGNPQFKTKCAACRASGKQGT